jgi:erythromycin esterase-like protein
MRAALRTLLLFPVLAVVPPAPAGAAAGSDSAATVRWMRRTAHAFEAVEPREDHRDLAFLKRLVGDARIVALGEGTHGTREFFTMKHRITRYLASEMGFTVFAIEANMPEAYRVNDYVLTGRGDPRALLDGMYFWTWNTREVLDLIEWMRAFNASGRGRMQFAGFDMQTPDTAAAIARRFLARTDPVAAESLDVCLGRLRATRSPPESGAFATATSSLPVAEFAGRHVRYSGWIRTDRVRDAGFAGLWMRADAGERRGVAFDNMRKQGVNETRGWQRYAIELDVPSGTTNINFGALLSGSGTAWFDSLAIEVDGKPWTGDGSLDLGLERADGPAGFWAMPPRNFAIEMSDSVARSGRRSLCIRRLDGGVTPEMRSGSPVTLARWLLERVERDRDRLAAASTPAEADWAIQNVRVVEQCARMRASDRGYVVRDESMAANVDWILAHEKPGTRIVLWAHNGHVARREGWMGSHLAKRHGTGMVVVGFAAHSGAYTAVKQGKGVRSDNALAAPDIECLEALCHATGLPRFVLDLRRAREDEAASRWFAVPRPMRTIGAMAMDAQFKPADIAREYDAIVFVDTTRATQPNHPDR